MVEQGNGVEEEGGHFLNRYVNAAGKTKLCEVKAE